jgi:GDP-mannose 6-dehydrogenase
MKIGVFGLGYVGITTAACLAHDGHDVLGVDVVDEKVDAVNDGNSPIVEQKIDDLVEDEVESGRLRATTEAAEAIDHASMVFICVGTPSQSNGSLDVSHVERVSRQIGELIGERSPSAEDLLVVLRSTVLPGTTRGSVIPALEDASGREVGDGYEVAFQPEFLREGSAVDDYYDPPKIVVGERHDGASDALWDVYESIDAPRFATSIEAAEAVKYADNAFHAVKITFANEIGQILKAHDVDSREVMDIFCQDEKLNISSKYLRPGFSFGGSCLPKDLRAITYAAKHKDIDMPMLDDVLRSNNRHIERAVQAVLDHDPSQVGIVGLAFKPGTDDLRESPLVSVAERLLGKGIEVLIHDRHVRLSKLMGTNKSYVEEHLPHLSELLVSSLDKLCESDVVVVGHPVDTEEVETWIDQGKQVVDLVGVLSHTSGPQYEGIAW